MQEITTTLKVDTIGRVMIPKHIREVMGIEAGDLVEVVIRKGISAKSESINPLEAQLAGVTALASA